MGGGLLCQRQITGAQIQVVEEKNHKTLRRGGRLSRVEGTTRRGGGSYCARRFRGALYYRKSSNDLRFAIVEDLEILFLEITHGITLAIADHNRHEYFIYVGLDRRANVRSGRFLLLGRQ